MGAYDGWSREDLIWKIGKITREKEDLEEKVKERDKEIYSLKFRISQELEPRIQAEKRAYDRWVTNPER